jgi:hypothetical protein
VPRLPRPRHWALAEGERAVLLLQDGCMILDSCLIALLQLITPRVTDWECASAALDAGCGACRTTG